MKATNQKSKIKALPFFRIVQQFAFLHDLPFFFYTDQLQVIKFYEESLKRAGGNYEGNA
jgi:hypothetical protein